MKKRLKASGSTLPDTKSAKNRIVVFAILATLRLRQRYGGLAMAFAAAVAVFATLSSVVVAQDWPQWRGPSRTGAVQGFKPPAQWPDRPKQIWKVQVGVGHASPIVVGSRVYLFSRAGEQEVISARDLASGKEIWRQAYDAPYQVNPAAAAHGKGPKSTPVHDRGRIFTFGIGGILSAWQAADGRRVWTRDFKKEFPSTVPEFGVAMSPAIVNGMVIVHVGGAGNGAVMALDPVSGETKWAWKGDGPAYASPIVATFAITPQIVTQTQRNLVSLGIDGRLLWQIPFATEFEQNAITPVVVSDLVIYGGISKPTVAIRPTLASGKWQTPQVWQNADIPTYMSTAVDSRGYLFGLTHRNRGQFFCVDARTGKTMWTTKGREGENAAMLATGEYILAMTTEAELVVLRNDPKAADVVKRYTIADSPVWAHPVVVGSGIIVKDVESLAYWVF
jgi:outer membrane protein assembly factor BamB